MSEQFACPSWFTVVQQALALLEKILIGPEGTYRRTVVLLVLIVVVICTAATGWTVVRLPIDMLELLR